MARVCCLPVLDAQSPTSGGQQAVLPPAAVEDGPSAPSSFWGPRGLLGVWSQPSILCTTGLLLVSASPRLSSLIGTLATGVRTYPDPR